MIKPEFIQLLENVKEYGQIKSPDFVAYFLPLLKEIRNLHHSEQVALITSIDVLHCQEEIHLMKEGSLPQQAASPLFIKSKKETAVEVKENFRQLNDLETNEIKLLNLKIHLDWEAPIENIAYLLSYKSWEFQKGHYDALTDIFQVGQLMASLAFGLDFREETDLKAFVGNRSNLYFLNKRLHPSILHLIFEMTELYREDRPKSLSEIIERLENYKQHHDSETNIANKKGFRIHDTTERSSWILNKLRNRLFDISRRNKLLYFNEKKNFLNLTIGSVPLLLNVNNIKEDNLIIWNAQIEDQVVKKNKIVLNKYLDFKQTSGTETTLNKIRLEAAKNKNEYGFSQLRTILAFVHWYNFKENADEKITSPLLLLPTEVVKKKGVSDQYELHFTGSEAEVNPILKHYLRELYGIQLPDFIDLETTTIDNLVESLQEQVQKGGTGISLNWRKKPQIQMIHSIAKRNSDIKNKYLVHSSRGFNLSAFQYSYHQDNFQPLGLEIFKSRIKHKNNALEYIINEDLKPQENAVADKERTFYSTDNEGEVNPTIWEIDTCNISIGNFNYRKMSLVRDYNDILEANTKDEIFEKVFSDEPKKIKEFPIKKLDLLNNFPIISSDPTQSAAVEIARTGESYIIQGPPGTGKSQTITNLIADYIARDKKILFVCEKRAALDVVFHRLKEKKLDELCCLIHDSQTDKKSFIQDLKLTYEDFMKNDFDLNQIQEKREKIIYLIEKELEQLSFFHTKMKEGDTPAFELYEILHRTKKEKNFPTEIELIHFPNYNEWKQNFDWIKEWFHENKINGIGLYLNNYPLIQVSDEIINSENPKKEILDKINTCTSLVDDLTENIDNKGFNFVENMRIAQWQEQILLAKRIHTFVEKNQLAIFDVNSAQAKEFENIKSVYFSAKAKFDSIQTKNTNWTQKFSQEETENALNQWKKLNANFLKFLNPAYYKLKKIITTSYNFKAHTIQPEVTQVLENLIQEHEAQKEIGKVAKQVEDLYGILNFEEEYAWIKELQQNPNSIITRWASSNQTTFVQFLIKNADKFNQFYAFAESLAGNIDNLTLSELDEKISSFQSALSSLAVFIPFIAKAKKLSKEFKACIYFRNWQMEDFEFHLAYKSLAYFYETNRSFEAFSENILHTSILKINALLDKYYASNVEFIRGKIRNQVQNKILISQALASQLSSEEKILKPIYNNGRKILENEFRKSMRYKSIRELAQGDSKDLMVSLKPVWLMSPLSVSDTMPIDTDTFDVVIYDEASQITIEEGVPSLFRTKQTIIVGDEMQMPPTNFFSADTNKDEDEEEIENKTGIALDAESLLEQGSRKLSSVMLGWHYRSRHESLISFSNAAFYQRNLLTIPDTKIQEGTSKPIEPIVNVNDEINVSNILDKSISFHYLENGIYDNRMNKDEAGYIAQMVSKLLKSKANKSIGIVAFSMQQQSEIEEALESLALRDSEFEALLEAEYQRVDHDQFIGLIVKNLENVQGDERDIIIMSICYGMNPQGKMLMNFGPINRRGGEKRLNVIFSRAKEHMVVVSSILANDIKNDYNQGANYFKRFLQYAKNMSDGRTNEAYTVLDGLHTIKDKTSVTSSHYIIEDLKEKLESKGYSIDLSVGQSHFRCDIGIKEKGSDKYILGILIDNDSFYFSENILEQYCQRPKILEAFGWTIYRLYSKDWLEKPEKVLEKIEFLISGKQEKTIDIDSFINENKTYVKPETQTFVEKKDETKPILAHEKKIESIQKQNDGHFERYEFIEGTSNKYWQIAITDTTVIVQYGRIGGLPQANVKTFPSFEEALNEKNDMARKKLNKGYRKVN